MSSRQPEAPMGAVGGIAGGRFSRAAIGLSLILWAWLPLRGGLVPDAPSLLLVVGAPGEPGYGTNHLEQAAQWTRVAAAAGAPLSTVGLEAGGDVPDRERVKAHLASEPPEGPRPLWVILVGHGTWDGQQARFNLQGPDVTAGELAQWLAPIRRPVAVINTASASAPFLKALAGTNRVVITATRSGAEQNVTRFGLPFANALLDTASDLDRDGQVSLLEAFLSASREVAEFYETAGRLATEHPLLEDSGDGLGTPADWFQGVRATKQARDGARLDGGLARTWVLIRSADEQALPAALRERRDALERDIEVLRGRKATLAADAYYAQLEALLLPLARIYEPEAAASKVPAPPEVSKP